MIFQLCGMPNEFGIACLVGADQKTLSIRTAMALKIVHLPDQFQINRSSFQTDDAYNAAHHITRRSYLVDDFLNVWNGTMGSAQPNMMRTLATIHTRSEISVRLG